MALAGFPLCDSQLGKAYGRRVARPSPSLARLAIPLTDPQADTICQPVPCCCVRHTLMRAVHVCGGCAGPAGGSIEAVLIPMLHRRGTRRHITLCVSSQVRYLLQSSTTNSHAAEKEPAVCVC